MTGLARVCGLVLPLGLVAGLVLACTGQSVIERDANPVRHDVEPLLKRFPELGDPVSASWVSGDVGDARVPGPSLYWIDAVVELVPETARQLVDDFAPEPMSGRPDVRQSLDGALPHGQFLTGEALDVAFTSPQVRAKAFLAQDVPVILITATGE